MGRKWSRGDGAPDEVTDPGVSGVFGVLGVAVAGEPSLAKELGDTCTLSCRLRDGLQGLDGAFRRSNDMDLRREAERGGGVSPSDRRTRSASASDAT